MCLTRCSLLPFCCLTYCTFPLKEKFLNFSEVHVVHHSNLLRTHSISVSVDNTFRLAIRRVLVVVFLYFIVRDMEELTCGPLMLTELRVFKAFKAFSISSE